MGHDSGVKSRVHPKYRTKYRVGSWAEYDRDGYGDYFKSLLDSTEERRSEWDTNLQY